MKSTVSSSSYVISFLDDRVTWLENDVSQMTYRMSKLEADSAELKANKAKLRTDNAKLKAESKSYLATLIQRFGVNDTFAEVSAYRHIRLTLVQIGSDVQPLTQNSYNA